MTARVSFSVLLSLLPGCSVPAPTPVAPPAPKDIRAVTRTFLEELIVKRRADSLTLSVYNTGWVRTRGAAVSSMKSWSAKVRLDVPVFLIKHPSRGYVLFDTGLSTSTARRIDPGFLAGFFVKFRSEPGRDIVSQLRASGVDLAEVRTILLSHLHRDHAGLADAFPQATVVVSRKEWDSQQAREYRWRPRLVDLSTAPPFGAFDHGIDLFEDGTVFLVDLPGHTPGNMGAWLNLDGGPVLLAGGAAWVIDNYMDLALPVRRGIADLNAYWRSLHIIRAMQEAVPRLVVFPGHDLAPRTLSQRDDLPLVPFSTKSQ